MHALINWYRQNSRSLPWRNSSDPYFIWLSEIILQQTRVEQGMPYYLRFIKQYPTVFDLANAALDEVLLQWQGLGYYSRARNMHTTAIQIATKNNGKFPEELKELKALKGIGDYTAAAIASIAFNKPVATIDGNVYRVLSRFFNENTPIDSNSGKHIFRKLAESVLSKTDPGTHNQAVMELGALVCLPQNPHCTECPLLDNCKGYHNNTIKLLPVKSKRVKVRKRYFNFLIVHNKNNLYIEKRDGEDIWQGLHQFPLIELSRQVDDSNLLERINDFIGSANSDIIIEKIIEHPKHVLSHQHIYARFVIITLNSPLNNSGLLSVKMEQMDSYAFPRLITRFIEKNPLDTLI